jgi:hypothetical protein
MSDSSNCLNSKIQTNENNLKPPLMIIDLYVLYILKIEKGGFLVIYRMIFILPLYFLQVRGADVLYARLWLIPEGLGLLLTRSWIERLTDRINSQILVQASLVVIIIGTVPFLFAGPDANPLSLALALFVDGIGLGGVLIPVMVSTFRRLAMEQIPHASSATRIFQLIGGAFGSAVIAVVIQQQFLIQGTSGIADVTNAYAGTFCWITGLAMIAILSSFALPLIAEESPNLSDELDLVN